MNPEAAITSTIFISQLKLKIQIVYNNYIDTKSTFRLYKFEINLNP